MTNLFFIPGCAQCGELMHGIIEDTDQECPSAHRCCSKECVEHYFELYARGWYAEFPDV